MRNPANTKNSDLVTIQSTGTLTKFQLGVGHVGEQMRVGWQWGTHVDWEAPFSKLSIKAWDPLGVKEVGKTGMLGRYVGSATVTAQHMTNSARPPALITPSIPVCGQTLSVHGKVDMAHPLMPRGHTISMTSRNEFGLYLPKSQGFPTTPSITSIFGQWPPTAGVILEAT